MTNKILFQFTDETKKQENCGDDRKQKTAKPSKGTRKLNKNFFGQFKMRTFSQR